MSPTIWTKRTKPTNTFTKRTKPASIRTWDTMTMTWANATNSWEYYFDGFLRSSSPSTSYTKRVKP